LTWKSRLAEVLVDCGLSVTAPVSQLTPIETRVPSPTKVLVTVKVAVFWVLVIVQLAATPLLMATAVQLEVAT